ncbi:MAG: methionine--tRNA ligase [Promethearchaeota archaeon]
MAGEQKPKFYVTTPIYYVNDNPHIGHAYTTLAADIIARFYRLLGYDVFFLTGTDEHGQKLEIAAKKAGMDPKSYVDKIVENFKKMNRELRISNDHFVRTTDDYHVEFCKLMYNKMKENGDIYKGVYEGLYCIGCEKFIRELDLVDGKCPLHNSKPQVVKEESYFFRMSRYQDALLEYYEKNPNFISPSFRRQELINRVKNGLNDLSISRKSISWGIPLPDDPSHVMYVWIDALSNYLSVLDYPGEKYKRYWPADVHLIGKDIAWFHMVIWPAMLLSAGFPLPKMVYAHGFWRVDGQKMSKTLGNVVQPIKMKKKYGLDAFRYYLFSKSQFGHDNDFSERELVDVNNTELADDLGNLVNRAVVLTQKYFKGKIPIPEKETAEEKAFSEKFTILDSIKELYKSFEFSKVLKKLWELLRFMNKYITETEPWVLYKNEEFDKLSVIIFSLLEGIRIISILLNPVMPETSLKIQDALNLQEQDFNNATWRNAKGLKRDDLLKVKKIILFTKKEYKKNEKKQGGKKKMTEMQVPDVKPEVKFDDFMKLDIRSAKILKSERFPDSKKLVKLEVECGKEKRTIVAGIGKYYDDSALVGKNIIIIVNLKPRKIHGVLSEGMLLAVDIADKPVLLTPDADVPSGYPVR